MSRFIKEKYLKAFFTSLICTLAAGIILVAYQIHSNNAKESRRLDELMSAIPAQLDKGVESKKARIDELDASFKGDILTVKYVMQTEGADSFFRKVRENGSFESVIYLVDRSGFIVDGSDPAAIGKSATDVCCADEECLRRMLQSDSVSQSPVFTDSEGYLSKVLTVPANGTDRYLLMPVQLRGSYASVYFWGEMSGLFGAVDERTFLTMIDNESLTFLKTKTGVADITGKPISYVGLDKSVTEAPSSGHSSLDGYGFRYKTLPYHSELLGDVTICSLTTDEGAVSLGSTIISLLSILIIAFLLQLYGFFIDEETGKLQMRVKGLRPIGKNRFIDTEKARVLLPFSLVSIIVVTAVAFYINTLTIVANQTWSSMWNIRQVSESLATVKKTVEENYDDASQDAVAFLQVTASVLEDNESVLACKNPGNLKKGVDEDGDEYFTQVNNPWLKGLAKVQNAEEIAIFDSKGRPVITSGNRRNRQFSRSDENYSLMFDVLDGLIPSCQVFEGNNIYIATPICLADGREPLDAVLVSSIRLDASTLTSPLTYIWDILDDASESGQCHYLMSVDGEEDNTVYCPDYFGTSDIADLNIPEEAFSDGYVGLMRIRDEKYYHVTRIIKGQHDDYFLMSLVPMETVYKGRSLVALSTFIVMLLAILVLLGRILICNEEEYDGICREAKDDKEFRKSLTSVQLDKLDSELRKKPTSSQRILNVIKKIWVGLLFLLTLSLIKGLCTSQFENLSAYLLSFAWQRGVNIFSLTTMLLITFSFSFFLLLLKKLMSVLGKALNASAETVCQLLVSLLRYSVYITIVFVSLYMLGVDTTGVLASLGAFSVMVGLGAKDLITDILAGISIIMEGDYKVGDIINVDGFCGKVTEIGIRTTKVEDIDGNVKILSNSSIGSVVNLTRKLSAVRLDIKISSRHKFGDVEQLFQKFFEKVENAYPQIKNPGKYLGVQESAPSYNVYRISIPCDEVDRAPLRRALIRDFSEFCEEEGIEKL